MYPLVVRSKLRPGATNKRCVLHFFYRPMTLVGFLDLCRGRLHRHRVVEGKGGPPAAVRCASGGPGRAFT